MPSSPQTPSRPRRRSSGFSGHLRRNTSQSSVSSPGRPHSRRSSNTSLLSTTTPRPTSAHGSGILPDLGSSLHGEKGLGSLADELAEEEWDEDIDEYEAQAEGVARVTASPVLQNGQIEQPPSPSLYPISKHEPGEGIAKTLEERIAGIATLARQGAGNEDTGALERVHTQLRELTSQANVETGLARLSTAHNAITLNLGNQSRLLTALTQHLLSPLALPPTPEVAKDLSEHIDALLLSLPQSTTQAHASAHELHELCVEVAFSLGQLGDTLQMTRQTTNHAARWLRSTAEAAETLRRELELAEEGRVWLDRNRCAERLSTREAAKSCREVIEGFEKVCDDWRARLVTAAQVEVVS